MQGRNEHKSHVFILIDEIIIILLKMKEMIFL